MFVRETATEPELIKVKSSHMQTILSYSVEDRSFTLSSDHSFYKENKKIEKLFVQTGTVNLFLTLMMCTCAFQNKTGK